MHSIGQIEHQSDFSDCVHAIDQEPVLGYAILLSYEDFTKEESNAICLLTHDCFLIVEFAHVTYIERYRVGTWELVNDIIDAFPDDWQSSQFVFIVALFSQLMWCVVKPLF